MNDHSKTEQTGAQLVVRVLEDRGVTHVFGVPGAKIDAVFNAIDGTYNMVAAQERLKYGRTSGIDFGPVDFIKYAEAFGATGLMIRTPEDIAPVMKRAFDTPGPVIVAAHVDYRDNHLLFETVRTDRIH